MIAIKGYSMPKDCINCVMQFGGWCGVSPPEVDERVAETVEDAVNNGKPEWCPLVEIDAEPVKRGRWIDWSMWGDSQYQCSECNSEMKFKTNFCPRCGARMDGGAEDG